MLKHMFPNNIRPHPQDDIKQYQMIIMFSICQNNPDELRSKEKGHPF
jgi:hypothetical protein